VNLLLVEPDELRPDGTVTLADRRARHLLDVLKVVCGQTVRTGVADGGLGSGRVTTIEDRKVTLACAFGETPPRPAVDLLLALPRPKVLHRLWAQLAAFGVGQVILTNAERVERHYFDTHVLEPSEYRPLLLDGLQQARDTRVPIVSVHRRFRVLVEDDLDALAGDSHRIVADPAGTTPVSAAVRASGSSRVLLAIGPEGGWNRFELDLLGAHGFMSVGLGPRTLRSDTACIALLALVHDALTAGNSKLKT
jgi:16S rRNA (uracil1498-N3)-methyltransferase